MFELYDQYVRLLDALRGRYAELSNFLRFRDARLQVLRSEIYEINLDVKNMRKYVSKYF